MAELFWGSWVDQPVPPVEVERRGNASFYSSHCVSTKSLGNGTNDNKVIEAFQSSVNICVTLNMSLKTHKFFNKQSLNTAIEVRH